MQVGQAAWEEEDVPDVGWYPSPECEAMMLREHPTLGERSDCGRLNSSASVGLEVLEDPDGWAWEPEEEVGG